jgi:PAS domain S-box-containing protein
MRSNALRVVASNSNIGGQKKSTRGRLSSADLLDSIIRSSDDAIVSKDLDGIIMSWNPAAERIFGYSEEEAVGNHITLVIPRHLHSQEDMILSRIRAGERVDHFEAIRRRKDGTLIDVSLSISPIKDDEGQIIGASKIARDISDQKRTERLLTQYRSRYELLHTLGKALSADLNLERIVNETVAAATKATGAQFGAFFYNVLNDKGESYLLYALSGAERSAFEKFGMPRNTAVFDATFKGTGTVRSDDIRQDPRYGKSPPHHGQPKGHLPVVSYLAVPVRSHQGAVLGGLFFGHERPAMFDPEAEQLAEEIAGIAGLMFDNARLYDERAREVERRRAAEETKELLLNEIKHRVKNLLATLEVIAAQSLLDVTPEVRSAFIARIRAIAGAHDLLTEHDWKSVDLGDVIEKGLKPFDAKRISTAGPDVSLEPNRSLMLTLVVHELGTNALKYGALSNGDGRVSISWDYSSDNELHLLWRETGGPPVQPPQRSGFGSTLIEKALRGSGGYAEILFEPTGVVCAITMAVKNSA